jgi:hypothetical protein
MVVTCSFWVPWGSLGALLEFGTFAFCGSVLMLRSTNNQQSNQPLYVPGPQTFPIPVWFGKNRQSNDGALLQRVQRKHAISNGQDQVLDAFAFKRWRSLIELDRCGPVGLDMEVKAKLAWTIYSRS